MQEIEALLRREIGLDAASIGSSLIERTIRLRMKELGLKKIEDYDALLRVSRDELNELIEAVVVTETWFFRDRQPFDAFRELVVNEWLTRPRNGPLRVLSVPCSSGEEPYSLAMTLLDAGISPEHFVIDAVDISSHALVRARKALYGKNSFRAKCLKFRDRYFRHTKEGFALNAEVKRCVNFHQENVLGDGFLSGQSPYHFILCRNLLIYFDRATQVRTLEKLHRLLAPNGVLLVGAAELPIATERGFVNANIPMAFACRKLDPLHAARVASVPRKRAHAAHATSSPAIASATIPGSTQHRNKPAAARAAARDPSGLDAARQFADAGQFADATAVCEAHIAAYGPSAEAYYLLGLVKDAAGDPLAPTLYRKALYLEPNHREALAHLALWLEKNGDIESARTIKRRAQRAEEKETVNNDK